MSEQVAECGELTTVAPVFKALRFGARLAQNSYCTLATLWFARGLAYIASNKWRGWVLLVTGWVEL